MWKVKITYKCGTEKFVGFSYTNKMIFHVYEHNACYQTGKDIRKILCQLELLQYPEIANITIIPAPLGE